MKKLLNITRKVLTISLILFMLVLTFLLVFYVLQNRRLLQKDRQLLANTSTRLIHSDTADISARLPLKLLPVPQKILIMEGFYQVPENPVYTANDSLTDEIDAILSVLPEIKATYSKRHGDIVIGYNKELKPEGYRMEILPGRIFIEFSDKRGLYYAFVSLKVLNHNHNGLLPCAIIEDYPDLPVRGLMLDISRDKVPTPQTLKQIVELIADLKYNHLQLYIEGFSYAYPSFRKFWENTETPLTGEEIRALDQLCKSRYIELVPNQNSLGHMSAWLSTEEYADLAECPDGFKLMGILEMKSTLDPTDPRSLELVKQMSDDLLPNFSSGKFNVNLDEPFELGTGKSKSLVEEYGLANVYLDYVLKIHDLVSERGKKMYMWGDVVLRHPEIVTKLPKDITLLDWGYESGYPFERNSKILEKSGMKFMLCPGTSSWTSITGRTDNMLGNIASAAKNAVKYGAEGMLLTDWGDMGHWQYLPVSYAGYVAGGALSWNSSSITKLPLTSFLNDYVFKDNRGIMGHLALDLGRYLQYEEIPVPNMTTTMLALQLGLNDRVMTHAIYGKVSDGMMEFMLDFAPEMVHTFMDKMNSRHPFDFTGLFTFLDEKESLLNKVLPKTSEGILVKEEYLNAIRLLRVGAGVQYYTEKRLALSRDERLTMLGAIRTNLTEYLEVNHKLWMMRNKPGGYERSTAALQKLLSQVEKELSAYDKPVVQRSLDGIGKMIKASIATLYLKFV